MSGQPDSVVRTGNTVGVNPLTLDEMRDAYRIGLSRNDACVRRGALQRYGYAPTPAERRANDGHSAVAEKIVARLLGREWLSTGDHPDDPDDGDVAGGYGVRWTRRTHGCLILHPEDPDHLTYVLVVGEAPAMQAVGYISGWDGKDSAYWRTDVRHPAYFVPRSRLHPISLLATFRGGS